MNRKHKRTAFIWNINLCNTINVFSVNVDRLNALSHPFRLRVVLTWAHLVNTGINQSFLSSPNTCWRFLLSPTLKPFLSGPFWNTGAENASEKQERSLRLNSPHQKYEPQKSLLLTKGQNQTIASKNTVSWSFCSSKKCNERVKEKPAIQHKKKGFLT